MDRCGFCKYKQKIGIFYWCILKNVKFYTEEDEREYGLFCCFFDERVECFHEKISKDDN